MSYDIKHPFAGPPAHNGVLVPEPKLKEMQEQIAELTRDNADMQKDLNDCIEKCVSLGELLSRASVALDGCGNGVKNGNVWETPYEMWQDAMAMRDEIDAVLKGSGEKE